MKEGLEMKMGLLEVRNLKNAWHSPSGPLHAMANMSFVIHQGTTMGVVGESGCGKSTLGDPASSSCIRHRLRSSVRR